MVTGTQTTSSARDRLCDQAARDNPAAWPVHQLAAFLPVYYEHVADDDLLGQDPIDLAGAVLAHRALAAQRTPGQAKVRGVHPHR